ncbi:uncharacterized protein LOC118205721, partial [Stegodyphus dumicola]|uniref:uncharacterized protein LOC118205721 n=1 Tax=Stegodyphus dumicola TaxID=202533 RepID=UPI0015AF01E2
MLKAFLDEKGALAWAGCRKGNSTFFVSCDYIKEGNSFQENNKPAGASAERHSFLQYAMLHFRDNETSRQVQAVTSGGSIRGTVKIFEYLTGKKSRKSQLSEWTWKELTDKVKYSP